MANAAWLEDVTAAVLDVHEALDLPIDVEVLRRTGASSSVTGEPAYGAPRATRATVRGDDRRVIASDGTVQDARHRVTLFSETVRIGDGIRWGGKVHRVLAVTGLVKNVDGDRYLAEAVTN